MTVLSFPWPEHILGQSGLPGNPGKANKAFPSGDMDLMVAGMLRTG